MNKKTNKLQKFFTSPKRWRQGSMGNNGNYCLQGAINHLYPSLEGGAIADKLVIAIARKTKKALRDTSIVDWNDSKKRKFADIQEIVKLANI